MAQGDGAAMKKPTGAFPRENIGVAEVPRPPAGVIETLSLLAGPSTLVSDVMDRMGLSGTISGSILKPVLAGRSIVGPALTLLKRPVQPGTKQPPLGGDRDARNLGIPGDILVIQGLDEVSCMGGLAALRSKAQGCLGAVIWGGCRDVAQIREIGYPVWSRTVTPLTGVGRIDGAFINGDVHLGGVLVRCGDIIVADDDGVCVIPRASAAAVAAEAAEQAREEAAQWDEAAEYS